MVMTKRKANSQDVAERAGVSRTTVSYVLNGRTDVAIPEETQARVRKAAQELSYRSNRLANGVLRGQTKLFGVVVPHLYNSFYSQILQGVHEECDRHGYTILLTHSRQDQSAEQQRVGLLMEYRVDALVCVTYLRSPTEGISWATETQQSRLPCVVLDCLPDDNASLDGVASDDKAGAHAAVTHLFRLGHRRIGHLVGDQRVNTGADRYDGYRRALRDAGLALDERIVTGRNYQREDGREGMQRLLALDQPPTAIFAGNDDIAEGALEALQERGLDAPRDIALVGYGNLEASRGFGLTTVDQDPAEMGRRAVQCVLARLMNPDLPRQRVLVPTRLIVRRTCGASRAA